MPRERRPPPPRAARRPRRHEGDPRPRRPRGPRNRRDGLPVRRRPRRRDGAERRLPVGSLDRLRRRDGHRARLRRLRGRAPRVRPEQGRVPPARAPRAPHERARLLDGGGLDPPRRGPSVAPPPRSPLREPLELQLGALRGRALRHGVRRGPLGRGLSVVPRDVEEGPGGSQEVPRRQLPPGRREGAAVRDRARAPPPDDAPVVSRDAHAPLGQEAPRALVDAAPPAPLPHLVPRDGLRGRRLRVDALERRIQASARGEDARGTRQGRRPLPLGVGRHPPRRHRAARQARALREARRLPPPLPRRDGAHRRARRDARLAGAPRGRGEPVPRRAAHDPRGDALSDRHLHRRIPPRRAVRVLPEPRGDLRDRRNRRDRDPRSTSSSSSDFPF